MKDLNRKLVFFPHCCLPQLQLLLTRQVFFSLWTISSCLPPRASRNKPSISCLENSWHSKPKSQFRHSLHCAPNFNLFQHFAHTAHGPPDCEPGNGRNFPIHLCSASMSPVEWKDQEGTLKNHGEKIWVKRLKVTIKNRGFEFRWSRFNQFRSRWRSVWALYACLKLTMSLTPWPP